LNYTDAIGCDFSHAEFNGTQVVGSTLDNSIFFKALVAATFDNASLANANFEGAYLAASTFLNIDLGKAAGLSAAHFYPPLTIDVRTLLKSGFLPKAFYRACGMKWTPSLGPRERRF